MKIVFMGTPEFALRILERISSDIALPAAVVTQPDRPAGRGKKIIMPPVKQFALDNGIPVFQPEHSSDITPQLTAIAPDFIVVAAFGMILKKDTLDIPRKACINVHASLLPIYRGASPINAAIIDCLNITGVTTMFMNEQLDAGDILLQSEIDIDSDDTAETLHDKLAASGAGLCVDTLLNFDTIIPRVQRNQDATFTPRLKKEDGNIDWSKSAFDIRNLIRGCTPWPGGFSFHDGTMIKIWDSLVVDETTHSEEQPGTILRVDEDGILVATGRGQLLLTEVQRQGKKRQEAATFIRGYSLKEGDTFSTNG